MKKGISILLMMIISLYIVKSEELIDIDFTRDSTFWSAKFPSMSWNTTGTDFTVSGINDHIINDFTFKGAFGKFNPGHGVYAQPFDSENDSKHYIWAFRIANTGSSYISFPEVESAGMLTIHCKSGNANESAVFYIEKFVEGKWERIKTMIASPHRNENKDVVLKQNMNISTSVKLRIYGASKNLHIYTINLKKYDPQFVKNKKTRLIILPDTQHYTQKWPHIFQSQTAWAANNADSISFVIHVGDITNANNKKQWPTAARAMSLMDGSVPYTFAPGNHDTGDGKGDSKVRNTDLLNQYMPYSKYNLMPNFGDVYETGRMENSWHSFSTENGYHYLIISLEFGPRDAVLEWAGEIIKNHPTHNIIINTHAYMYSDNNRISTKWGHKWTPSSYGLYADSGGDANDGEEIWTKLVKLHPNIFMVVSGHVLFSGTGTLVSEGDNGNKVYQMLSNYQTGVIGSENGGNGFLRIIDINEINGKMHVRTYSPFLNTYKTEKDQEFSFDNLNLIKNTDFN